MVSWERGITCKLWKKKTYQYDTETIEIKHGHHLLQTNQNFKPLANQIYSTIHLRGPHKISVSIELRTSMPLV